MFYRIMQKTARSMMSTASVKTIILCAVLTGVLMLLWVGGVYVTLGTTSIIATSWMDRVLDFVLGTGSVIMAYFLFPLLLPVIASLFLDGFMEKISQQDYGKTLRSVPLHEELPKTLLFVLQTIIINVLLLPVYGVLMFIPPLNIGLYYSVNGYLLAKEFWVMASDRMMIEAPNKRDIRGMLFMAGIFFMVCANIPPLTLVTPLMAAAFMLHFGYYALNRGIVRQRANSKDALQPHVEIIVPEKS